MSQPRFTNVDLSMRMCTHCAEGIKPEDPATPIVRISPLRHALLCLRCSRSFPFCTVCAQEIPAQDEMWTRYLPLRAGELGRHAIHVCAPCHSHHGTAAFNYRQVLGGSPPQEGLPASGSRV